MLQPHTTGVPDSSDPNGVHGRVMVVGGGVGGMRAAVDLAEAGLRVILVEATPG